MSLQEAMRVETAAQNIEAAVHRLELLLADGYGGNGLRLIELLTETADVARFALLKEAVRQLNADQHKFGTGPCSTCSNMTTALGEPFGCEKRRGRKL